MLEELFKLINAEREKVGVAPLINCQELTPAANLRAKEAATLWSHTRPDGTPYWHVDGRIWGENLAKHYGTAREVISAWMNSPLHKKNILNEQFKGACIGIFNDFISLEFTK